jgi:regulator of sirC expression with transglutaminase-like and TPR domain
MKKMISHFFALFFIMLFIHCSVNKQKSDKDATESGSVPVLIKSQLENLSHILTIDGNDSILAAFNRAEELLCKRLQGLSPLEIIDSVCKEYFVNQQITFIDSSNELRYIYPHFVYKNKRGTCLGLSLLLLSISEKMKLPVFGVLVPRHIFVRFDSDSVERNIETLRKGESMSFEWYCKKYGLDRYSVDEYYRNLSNSEVVGVIYFNIANNFMEKGQMDDALKNYYKALDFFPSFNEGKGNLAFVLEQCGEIKHALLLLNEMKMSGYNDKKSNLNLGIIKIKQRKYTDAHNALIEALKSDSNDPVIYYSLGYAKYCIGDIDSSKIYLHHAIRLKSDYTDANGLLQKIGTH